MAGDVERLESWQLPAYLKQRRQAGAAEITWNREKVPLDEAERRAAGLDPAATVVADGDTIYVAIPDHSADEAPRISPIQLGPRRGA